MLRLWSSALGYNDMLRSSQAPHYDIKAMPDSSPRSCRPNGNERRKSTKWNLDARVRDSHVGKRRGERCAAGGNRLAICMAHRSWIQDHRTQIQPAVRAESGTVPNVVRDPVTVKNLTKPPPSCHGKESNNYYNNLRFSVPQALSVNWSKRTIRSQKLFIIIKDQREVNLLSHNPVDPEKKGNSPKTSQNILVMKASWGDTSKSW